VPDDEDEDDDDDEDDELPVPVLEVPAELLPDELDPEPELPDELDVEPELAPFFAALVPLVALAADAWAEPGSVAAMAPVASTLATPTPAVTADSRLIPRRRSAGGGSGRPS
jgi:hypothetical protein